MWFAVPLGRYVPHRKEQQLEERIVGREHSPCLSDLPQLPVEALYGIGGIDQAPQKDVSSFQLSLQLLTAAGYFFPHFESNALSCSHASSCVFAL